MKLSVITKIISQIQISYISSRISHFLLENMFSQKFEAIWIMSQLISQNIRLSESM